MPPIPPGHVVPILSAMQGHPESPRLWEKHADEILRNIGLTPTIHEPCLYSGNINGQRVLFMRQVDDFAIATPDAQTSDILMDMIDDRLRIPIKRQGYLDMYNGIDILQTRHYIKINVKTFVNKIFEPYLATWMPTPLPRAQRHYHPTLRGLRNSMQQLVTQIKRFKHASLNLCNLITARVSANLFGQ
jgi:hypothetical protein